MIIIIRHHHHQILRKKEKTPVPVESSQKENHDDKFWSINGDSDSLSTVTMGMLNWKIITGGASSLSSSSSATTTTRSNDELKEMKEAKELIDKSNEA